MRNALLAWLLLAGCAPPDPGDTRIIGHGGSGVDAETPLNSRESLLRALSIGADGIELDAQLTADSVLVALHPLRIEEGTACTGIVNAHRWEDLKSCPSIHGDASFPLVRIDSLLLEAAFAFPAADFTLDCKLITEGDWWGYLHAFTDAVLAIEDHQALKGRLLVDCQTEDFLHLLTTKRSGFPAFLYAPSFDTAIERAKASGCVGITLAYDRVDAQQAAQIKQAGLALTLFGTASEWSHRHALSLRPVRLQTDLPAYALGLRRASP